MTGFSARYDLASRVPTFDFFTWLVHVKTLGATEIVLSAKNASTRKFPEAEVMRRYESIIKPGPALAGLPCREGEDGEDVGSHMLHDIAPFGRDIARLATVFPPRAARYTVTLRNTFHRPEKNSDVGIWRRFAAQIGAVVIEDYAELPLSLHDRVALYAGAEMNFGVTNGPMALCSLTEYPMRMFSDPETTAVTWAGHGIRIGDQYPYALPNQRIVWLRPTFEDLMREFEALPRC